MTMRLLFTLTLCSFAIKAKSQNLAQRSYYNEPRVDPQQIYFTDNVPKLGQNLRRDERNATNIVTKLINRAREQVRPIIADTSGDYSHEPFREVDVHQYAIQQSILQNANTNSMKQENAIVNEPSVNLQPPSYENRNYYDVNTPGALQLSVLSGRYGEINGVNQVPAQNSSNHQADRVSLAISNFALNLMKNVNQLRTGNVVVSPYSIATVLALLQQGALGETQQQISRALQMPPDMAAMIFKRFTEDLQKRFNDRNILKVASNVFVADAFQLNPAFKSNAIKNFGSEVTPLSFARPEIAVKKINNWVATKTNNKIDKLVTEDSISDNTQLVLTNAVYFKGLWQTSFKPEATLTRDFHLKNGATTPAAFMRSRLILKGGIDEINNVKVIVLPFEKKQYSLVVILPSEASNIDNALSTLTEIHLAGYQNFPINDVELELPRFIIKTDTDLNPVLRKMGITNIFGQSELSGLGSYRDIPPQVSSALHTAMLTVDEQGATAAAATAFAVVALSYDEPSMVFKANRPFLAVLWDNQLSLPLFIARIEDPTL